MARIEDEEPQGVELSRRSMAGALGALGAMFGLGALAGCETTAGDGASSSVVQSLVGTSLRWCDTFAELRAIATGSLTAGEVVIVQGHWAAGDGGGGVFYWDPSPTWLDAPYNTIDDDGGTFVRPTSVAASSPGRWRRLHDPGVYSARWFGARGDGTTDDTQALQRMLDSVPRHPVSDGGYAGVKVVFPRGIYRLGDLHVDRRTTIEGIGTSHTILLVTPRTTPRGRSSRSGGPTRRTRAARATRSSAAPW